MTNLIEQPKCACGFTKNPEGFCDGSHANLSLEDNEPTCTCDSDCCDDNCCCQNNEE